MRSAAVLMDLLLDTHALLWWLADDPTLSDVAVAVISDESNAVFVSAASAWEISIKAALGKLDVPDDLLGAMGESDLAPLPITVEHALLAGVLPPVHSDPFDRMLAAQATIEQLAIVTRDPEISRYGVATVPA